MSDSSEQVQDSKVTTTEFRSLDGLRLRGTLVVPSASRPNAAVLVHGGGVTREEGGFFTRLASRLASAGIASLRFDFRAHGESEGRQEDLTLAGVVNDIRSAVAHVRDVTGSGPVHVIGTSFGGGISAFFATRYPEQVQSLVLLNPLLNYKNRFVDDKPYWANEQISEEASRELAEKGFVAHSPSFKLGRPLLNEVFYLRPHEEIEKIAAPTLVVHGTRDTFIPVESSRKYIQEIKVEAKLLEIEGAQHGFAVHDDPEYRDPQSQEWQAFVIQSVTDWALQHS
ncbi:Alpha/beta hydrolase fold [Carbonactinospora thermoautotrophica]|uniref:Alpha/beta hydrolase fold n=1 Tax=Carbonactinospora thermoautotrophica TaxID=1469144 RepID=A0A132MMR8_9ACTN|nr:alpha/beta fold hydrolase [Carbonactinospora thermoautotrophica]KWW99154.1 Alpha/beta hydrolase fold [Carbonactinospora thermoautotrophica]